MVTCWRLVTDSVYHMSHMTHQMTDVGETESMLNQTDLWFFRGIRQLRKVGSEQTFVVDRWSKQTAEGAPLLTLIVLHPSPKRSVQTFGTRPCDILRELSQWMNLTINKSIYEQLIRFINI